GGAVPDVDGGPREAAGALPSGAPQPPRTPARAGRAACRARRACARGGDAVGGGRRGPGGRPWGGGSRAPPSSAGARRGPGGGRVHGQALPGYLYLPPAFSGAGLEVAVAHALHVASALSVPLALENPVVVQRNGPLHVLDFMGRLHARTGCPLVLDVGHLVAAQLASRLPLETGLDGFPFEAVIEVHVAGAVITRTPEGRGVYLDDHGQPLRSEVLALLAEVLPRCRALRALVFEGDGHPVGAARRTLATLRTM